MSHPKICPTISIWIVHSDLVAFGLLYKYQGFVSKFKDTYPVICGWGVKAWRILSRGIDTCKFNGRFIVLWASFF